jgi:hypothetical protein
VSLEFFKRGALGHAGMHLDLALTVPLIEKEMTYPL